MKREKRKKEKKRKRRIIDHIIGQKGAKFSCCVALFLGEAG